VEILFRAIYDTSNQVGAQATVVQDRNVIGHITELVSLLPNFYLSSLLA
jgi:hypothetical protein